MKIEIGENLIASYLRHVEDCRIVQTNWKPSSQWKITKYEEKKSRELFETIKSLPLFNDVFKNNSYEQLIKQAEIDVIGINTTEKSVFGIDIAFHIDGLNYSGGAEATKLNVLKKIFRTIFVLQTYFSEFDKFNTYFVTPKANPPTEIPIHEIIEEVNKLINDEMISIKFISNDAFFELIVDPTINNLAADNDTSELFLRSIKLMQLDKRTNQTSKNNTTLIQPKTGSNKTTIDGMKIGQFVKYNMRKLFEQNMLTQKEITNLQDKEYSMKIFRQNYAVLKSPSQDVTESDDKNRYYANEKFFGQYNLTSQWVERHWTPFKIWLENITKVTKNT